MRICLVTLLMRDRSGYETSPRPLVSWRGEISVSRIPWDMTHFGYETVRVSVAGRPDEHDEDFTPC